MTKRTRLHELTFEAYVKGPQYFAFEEHDRKRLSEVLEAEIEVMFREQDLSYSDMPELLDVQPKTDA